jgi:beta-galactosidase GanA
MGLTMGLMCAIRRRTSVVAWCLTAGLLAIAPPAAPASAASTAQTSAASPAALSALPAGPHTVGFDRYSVKVDGKRVFLWSGEFHYWRLPSPDLWRDVLQKLKASGMNAVSIYFHWGFHSPAPGVYDFTGVRDVDRLLDMAAEAGLYVIARPGPYINAETDGGGFPAWLGTQKGRARSTAPDYLAASREWLGQIDGILRRHQVTDGTGPVLLYQVENELYDPDGRDYVVELSKKVRADGITVPLVGNEPFPQYAGGDGLDFVGELDQYVSFCNGRWWLPELKRQGENMPLGIFESGTGFFRSWGDSHYDKCREPMGPSFQKIVYKNQIMQGTTIDNLYMAYGGTNWGWIADPRAAYTSYDYSAPITEERTTGAQYDEIKRQGLFYTTVAPLTETEPVEAPVDSNAATRLDARANPRTKTQFMSVRHADENAGSDDTTSFSWVTPDGTYPVSTRLNGKTAKILVAGYDLGGSRLVYSTSEIMTHAQVANRDVAVLYGGDGDPGQTMLRYASRPNVTVLDGSAQVTWDAARNDLRLDYEHSGLVRVLISGGGRGDLILLIGTDKAAAEFWRQDTAAGPVIERGTKLVRTAAVTGPATTRTLALTGDADRAGPIEVFAPAGVRRVTWNGVPLQMKATASGSLLGAVPGPRPVLGSGDPTRAAAPRSAVLLPELTSWKYAYETPEADPAYDDSAWTFADRLTTNNPTAPGSLPVLYQDEYGFHHGHVWYRGHFRATGTEKSLSLAALATNPIDKSAKVGAYSVWVNGRFLGTHQTGSSVTALPPGLLRTGTDNVVAVLVGTMGHNQDFVYNSDDHKQPRGLTEASLGGSEAQITWRIQGARGGERPVDPVRGHMNTGGLYGERSGWTLPGFPDRTWQTVSLPRADAKPGVGWYRTTFGLDLPDGQDVSLGIKISDDLTRNYRALIYVNGWLMGQYVNDIGPQRVFPIPAGILRGHGENTVAIAAWSEDASTGGIGRVSLTTLGNVTAPLRVADVPGPGYNAETYAEPRTPARVTVDAPDVVEPGRGYAVTATVAVPATGEALRDVAVTPQLPDGWSAAPATAVQLGDIDPGGSARATWTVSVPAAQKTSEVGIVAALATFTAGGRSGSALGERVVAIPPPPLAPGKHYVSDLPFTSTINGWGAVERDRSNGELAPDDGKPITLHDVVYPKGLGAHATSRVRVWLGGQCSSFHAALGIDQEMYGADSGLATVTYTVLADGVPVYESERIDRNTPTQVIDVPVKDAQRLELVVGDAGDGNGADHADWADAHVTCD